MANSSPIAGDSYIDAKFLDRNTTEYVIDIDNNVKSIILWYYNKQEDDEVNPNEILEKLSVVYGSSPVYDRIAYPYGYNDLSKGIKTNARGELPITKWLVRRQYNAQGELKTYAYSICSYGYIPIIKGDEYEIIVDAGYRAIFREFDDSGVIRKSGSIIGTTARKTFDYDNVTVTIISDNQLAADISFADHVIIKNVELFDAISEAQIDIDTLNTNFEIFKNDLKDDIIFTQSVGESVFIPSDKTVTGLKVYTNTEFTTMHPSYNNPATYSINGTIVSLSEGVILANDLSLDRQNARTKTINIDTLAQGYHTLTVDIKTYTADKSVSLEFRDTNNNSVGIYYFTQGVTGKNVINITLSGDAVKIYVYIPSSATAGVFVADIIVDAELPITSSSLYGFPIRGGGQCTMGGRVYLCDVIDFTNNTVERNVSIINASDVISATRLNQIDGNTLFAISFTMNNPLLNAKMPNYFCTHFEPETAGYNNGNIGMYIFNNTLRFRVPSAIADTVEEFLTWYHNNNVTVFYPRNTPTVTAMDEATNSRYNAIMSHQIRAEIVLTNGWSCSVSFADTYKPYGVKIIKPRISPENFGAYGDGVHDDTNALQSAINEAILVGGMVECSGAAKYAVKGLQINGRMSFSGNYCTLIGTTENPVITVYRTINQPNGYITDLTIDMNGTSSCGIAIVNDWRGQYKNITLNNPPTGGYGLRTYGMTGGVSVDTLNGRNNSANADTTFVYIDSFDMNLTNLDWQNYVVGIWLTGSANCIINNAHGYIASNSLFNDSVFLRTGSRLTLINSYPDTQRKFYEINTNRGVTIIGGSSWYNSDVITFANKEQGYLFYTDNPSYFAAVTMIGFNFQQPDGNTKPCLVSNQESTPTFIGCYKGSNDGVTPLA